MKKLLILMPNHFAKEQYSVIQKLPIEIETVVLSGDEPKEIIMNALKESNYLIWSTVEVTKEMLNNCTQLEFVQKWGTGVDGIDLKLLNTKQIPVSNVAGGNAISVAEHFFALLMAFYKKVCISNEQTHNGYWVQASILESGIGELNGSCLGILGLGKIGKEIAKRALAFQMNVLYNNRSRLNPEEEKQFSVEFRSLDELVRQVDVLCLSLSLNEQSQGIIRYNLLKKMKKKAVLINVSRGAVIHEMDLVKALKEGLISGACLDVFEREPLSPTSELLACENVILTPHTAGRSQPAMRFISEKCAENIVKVYNGQTPDNIIKI